MSLHLKQTLDRIQIAQVNDVRDPSFVGRLFVRP